MSNPIPGDEAERALFEAATFEKFAAATFDQFPSGGYKATWVQDQWIGWQMGRAAGAPAETAKVAFWLNKTDVAWLANTPDVNAQITVLREDGKGRTPFFAAPQIDATTAEDLAFNAQRLRNVAHLVGLQGAIPDDDSTLDGARGAVLGQIAMRLRGEAAIDKFAALATAPDVAKDAARYRWLLENYAFGDGYHTIDAALNDGSADLNLSPAIDTQIAAMGALPPTGSEKGGA